MNQVPEDLFLAGLPTFDEFDGVEDVSRYSALPVGWVLAVADVVDSTGAISQGKYKNVNPPAQLACASMVSVLLQHNFRVLDFRMPRIISGLMFS